MLRRTLNKVYGLTRDIGNIIEECTHACSGSRYLHYSDGNHFYGPEKGVTHTQLMRRYITSFRMRDRNVARIHGTRVNGVYHGRAHGTNYQGFNFVPWMRGLHSGTAVELQINTFQPWKTTRYVQRYMHGVSRQSHTCRMYAYGEEHGYESGRVRWRDLSVAHHTRDLVFL